MSLTRWVALLKQDSPADVIGTGDRGGARTSGDEEAKEVCDPIDEEREAPGCPPLETSHSIFPLFLPRPPRQTRLSRHRQINTRSTPYKTTTSFS